MAGIYIHIPFCKKLCHYCDFYHVIYDEVKNPFIDALLKEAEQKSDYAGGESISTIYFGGGTPSVFQPDEFLQILNHLKNNFKVESGSEITVELNPDDITIDYLKALKNTGINRISIGVQSWQDKDLKLLNRRHTSLQASKALEEAILCGFENITIDLIYGIPGMNGKDWTANLERTFSFGIQHLSAYHLTVEPDTVFGKMKAKGQFSEIDENESAVQFNILVERTEKEGFIQYEISNFGKPGYFSKHNTNYWKQIPYIGLGPSAHSYNGYSRQWNLRDLKKYIKFINTGKTFFEREEYIMVSLRTMWGIDLNYIEETFEKEGYDYLINLAGKYIGYGMMKQNNNSLILTNQGKMISDNIISEFMMPDHN
jgi:oxygen-independent coproporphyrinogen-3 oxidase